MDEIKALQLTPTKETPVTPATAEEKLQDTAKKRHLVVVLIGHVDAGKSTTGGQILFLSGQVDERTKNKYEKEAKDKNRESWYMAYIMDTNEEERAKGITIDVGKAYFETQTTRFTILDAPGHKKYIPNMITGASQADVGILVVSARKGEFETGFVKDGGTHEHVLLAKTLGVSKLVVVINKMDDPTVNWSKERYDAILSDMRPFLKSSGYNVKRDVRFLPISGLVGTNMPARVDRQICPWWDGPCLFEALDAIESPPRNPNAPLRILIRGKHKDMGSLVLTGKVESGTIRKGDDTVLVVATKVVTVKVDAVYCDEDSDETIIAGPGEIVRIKLFAGTGIEEAEVFSGCVLCSVANPIQFVSEFTAQLQIVGLMANSIFTARYQANLHIHSATEDCEIVKLLYQIDTETRGPMRKKVVFATNGDVVVCRVKVKAGVCIEKFDDFQQLGRFTIRDDSSTIAIGKVVDLSA